VAEDRGAGTTAASNAAVEDVSAETNAPSNAAPGVKAPAHAEIAAPLRLGEWPRYVLAVRPYSVEPIVPEEGYGVPLLDVRGAPIGPVLTPPQFCALAARASGVIGQSTYQVVDIGPVPQTFCGLYFPRLQRRQPLAAVNLSRSRFVRIAWPFGLGAYDYRLVPGHTAAAARFDIGTVLYAPSLRGIRLSDGSTHDGYLLVGDGADDGGRDDLAIFAGLAGAEALPAGRLPPSLEAYVVRDARLRAAVHARYEQPDLMNLPQKSEQ
jgi:hypothetical protein